MHWRWQSKQRCNPVGPVATAGMDGRDRPSDTLLTDRKEPVAAAGRKWSSRPRAAVRGRRELFQ